MKEIINDKNNNVSCHLSAISSLTTRVPAATSAFDP